MRRVNLLPPYPDELLFSALARFGRHHLMTQPQQILQALFGDRTRIPSATLPMRLGPLAEHLGMSWGLAPEGVALGHTLLPYYLIGKSGIARRKALDAVLADQPTELAKSLGINASRIKPPTHLRYCPCCVAEDRERYGETFWHRSHQLPGVFVCPTHGERLRISAALLQPRVRQALVATEAAIDVAADPVVPVGEADTARALAVARHSCSLLARSEAEPGDIDDQTIPMPWQGYADLRGPSELRQLQCAFIAYYGEELVPLFEPAWRPGASLGWLHALRRSPRRALHPMRWILLHHFLTSGPWAVHARPFGPGPWQCRNPLAPHFGECVVMTLERVHDHRHPDRVIGRFTCDCGFVYTQTANGECGDRGFRVVAFGPLFRERARQLAAQGLSTRAVAKTLAVDWKTANRLITDPQSGLQRRTKVSEAIKRDRAAWIALVDAHPDEGSKTFRAKAPALYMRLYRHDPDWLRAHSPGTRRTQSRRERVDWVERDREWAKALMREAASLRAQEPGVRMTRTLLAKRLGIQASLEKNLVRLPATMRVLDQLCETREAYRARRLKAAVAELGYDWPLWQACRLAGLRPEHVTYQVLRLAGLAPTKGDINDAIR